MEQTKLMELLKHELDKRRYYFGDHFATHSESRRQAVVAALKTSLRFVRTCVGFLFRSQHDQESPQVIICDGYFSLAEKLKAAGNTVLSAPWSISFKPRHFSELQLCYLVFRFRILFHLGSYQTLLSSFTGELVDRYIEAFSTYLRDVKLSALIVSNEVCFFEQVAIRAARSREVPTYEFLHGMPAYPAKRTRVDHLLVWGEQHKRNLVDFGCDESQVSVTGHPNLDTLPVGSLKAGLESVLVFTKGFCGVPPTSDGAYIPFDRFKSIQYLEDIQWALMQVGVKKARLRSHPGSNSNWFKKFIDTSFYRIDGESLPASLARSSVVVGPTSTGLVDAALKGLAYIVFEPMNKDKVSLVNGDPIGAPFEGSDQRICVCKNKAELASVLGGRIDLSSEFLKSYIKTPFEFKSKLKNFYQNLDSPLNLNG